MVTIGKRPITRVLGALVQKRHYIALKNMLLLYPKPFHNLRRYVGNQGTYPYRIAVRTPQGPIHPCLYSYHDLQTVNEIFCRLDYSADQKIKVVVDIGSNIGISALYFLTRNPECKAFIFEPLTRNVERLRANLREWEERYHLQEIAVADFTGTATFSTEESGRYGGIAAEATQQTISVPCLHINQILESVLQQEERIDILKIDIEGYEREVLNAIDPQHLKRIRTIYAETAHEPLVLPFFHLSRSGDVLRYTAF